MTCRSLLIASSALVAASVVLAPHHAAAQDSTGEEIIITATKRPQSIQDVPIAVSAYNAELLTNAGVTDLRELTQLSPSLFLSSSASESAGAVARIRGVGTTGDNPGLESSVAVFIDGVYRNRTNVGLTELGALERVEVLRGPQGTLFGRNASAGLINVVTAKPTDEFTGYAEASYGNFDYFRLGAGLSGPLGDKVAARVDGVYTQRDGFLTDKVTGQQYNDRDRYLIRGQLRVDASDALTLLFIGDYASRNENCCAGVTINRGATAAIIEGLGGQLGSGGSTGDPDPFDRRSATSRGRGFQQDVQDWGLSLQADWELEFATLTSITSYRDWQADRSQDLDFTSLDILYRDFDTPYQRFETMTQELRLNGVIGNSLDWLLGFYYADEDLTLDDAILFGRNYRAYADALVRTSVPTFPGYANFRAFVTAAASAPPSNPTTGAFVGSLAPVSVSFAEGGGVVRDLFEQNSENWAIFTHNIITLSDNIDLTLGARYTEERKTLDVSIDTNNPGCAAILGFLNNPALPAAFRPSFSALAQLPCLPFFNPVVDGSYDGSRKESELSGTAAINFIVNDDLSTYASYSRGYKAGGFNLDRAALSTTSPDADDDLQFDEETVDSFEVGAKYRSPNRIVSINSAVFYSRFEDFQLNTFNGISFVVENLPKVKSYGAEIEATLQATDNLTFNGGVTYADTQYGTGFTGAIFAPPSAGNPAGGALWQLPGRTITNAPKWSFTGAASYEQPVGGDLLALMHVDFRYTSRINTGSDLDLEKEQAGVFVVNGRVGLGNVAHNWRVELWGRNLFDKDYVQVAFDGPLQGSGTARNTILPNTQTFNAFLAEPRMYGITLRGEF